MPALTDPMESATLVNKKKVDSSRDRGEPIEFTAAADEMIKGLDQHVMKMSLGERLRLHISADLAYGEQGVNSNPASTGMEAVVGPVPPNSDLLVDVQLLKVGDKEA